MFDPALSSMPCRCPITLAVCALLLFALGACDDPSGVGLDVGGFEGGTPVTVALEPSTFEVTDFEDITGNSARILVGTVDDPSIGTAVTTGYFDVSPPDNLPDGFEGASVQQAELVLIPNYVYGDTLDTRQIGVYNMQGEWDAEDRTPDDAPTAGGFITESTPFAPHDTVTIDLPSSWVPFSSLSDTTDFDENFHGFQLRASSGNAVVGYSSGASYLRVVAGQDTVNYDVSKSFTAIDASVEAAPSERLLLQDGTGQAVSLRFTLPDSLQNAPISRAELRLPTDTTLLDEASLPDHFVRPQTNTLVLEGFAEEDDLAFAVSDSLNAEGVFAFSAGEDLLTNRTVVLRSIYQALTLGESSIDRYRVTLSQSSNTINPLLFYLPGAGNKAPRLLLTITTPED